MRRDGEGEVRPAGAALAADRLLDQGGDCGIVAEPGREHIEVERGAVTAFPFAAVSGQGMGDSDGRAEGADMGRALGRWRATGHGPDGGL